jgi:hypothetical protein
LLFYLNSFELSFNQKSFQLSKEHVKSYGEI